VQFQFTSDLVPSEVQNFNGLPYPLTNIIIPQIIGLSPFAYDPQTGFLGEDVQLANPSTNQYDDILVTVANLPLDKNNYQVGVAEFIGAFNAAAGSFYTGPMGPFTNKVLHLDYLVSDGVTVPQPAFSAAGTASNIFLPTVGTYISIASSNIFAIPQGTLIEWLSVTNTHYYVEWAPSLDGFATNGYKVTEMRVPGNGGWVQWTDTGPPKTDSRPPDPSVTNAPSSTFMRFYRLLQTE
jgi:hypothetical protein